MKLNIDDFYSQISDLMSKSEFKNRISKYSKKYSGLINDDVIAYMIIDELGRNFSNYSNISALYPGSRATMFVTVAPPEPKIFTKRKDARPGAEVFISDSTGRARLILWDKQHVELIENKQIKLGTKLKIINAKISKSQYGIDLSLDRFESLIINPSDFPEGNDFNDIDELNISDISNVTADGPVNVIGTISGKNSLRTFYRKDKSEGQVLNLELYDGTGSIRITLWDEHARIADGFSVGDHIKIINGYSKLHNSVREIHTNYRTKLIKDKTE